MTTDVSRAHGADSPDGAGAAYLRLVMAAAALNSALTQQRQLSEQLPQAERARHSKAIRELRERRDRALREAVERRDARVGAAQGRHARHADRMREQRTEAEGKVQDLAESQLEQAQAQLERALWMAETIYESGEHAPRERFDKAKASLDAAASRVRQCLGAMELLARRSAHSSAMRVAKVTPAAPPPDARVSDVARDCVSVAQAAHAELARSRLVRLARPPVLAAIAVCALGLGAGIGAMGATAWNLPIAVPGLGPPAAGGAILGALAFGAVSAVAAGLTWARAQAIVRRCSANAHWAAWTLDTAVQGALGQAQSVRRREEQSREAERDLAVATAKAKWDPVIARIQVRQAELLREIESRYAGVSRQLDETRDAELACAERECAATIESARSAHDAATAEEMARHSAEVERIALEQRAARSAAATAWRAAQVSWGESVRALAEARDAAYPAWDSDIWRAKALPPAASCSPGALVGSVRVRLESIEGAVPADADLAWPPDAPLVADLPLCLALPERGSLLVETDLQGRSAGIAMLHQAMLRLLTSLPPGKVQFLLADPVGMGESFAGLMHLADESDAIIGGRIWSEPRHIEQRLADISEHLETVIQKYLRDEFASLDEYNRRAGEIAEPYRFVVMCDFPASLTDEASQRLSAIAAGGARCGVHTIILRDARQPDPPHCDMAMVRQRSLCIASAGGAWTVRTPPLDGLPAMPAPAPSGQSAIDLVRRLGRRASESRRVEVPFSAIAPPEGAMWTESSAKRLSVPLGRAGATRLQRMVLGEGTRQHALIAGRTGSGKSTLLHALVTNLALHYSPDEVEMWLIDFKKGVEFRTYATHRLPHARVIAIESDREFGISVLQGLDAELRRRGELFRAAGVQDLPSYRMARPSDPLPRALLIIDEFQELFIEDDHVAQEAGALLDRIVRQGRAFGMHAILGSQTLGGAYTIARSTMGQMGVRIALQCNESDSQLILSDDNLAARLLARPGEAIYNDAGGLLEGNSPFQVVWLGDRDRDALLSQVSSRASGWTRREPMVIFEGNAQVHVGDCVPLRRAREIRAPGSAESMAPKVWLGEAVAIAEPTHVTLQRRSGANVVVVSQGEEQAVAMGCAAIESIAAQCPDAELVLVDSTTPDLPHFGSLERCAAAAGLPVRSARGSGAAELLASVAAEVSRRESSQRVTDPALVVMVHGIQRVRALRRKEDDYSFGASDDPPSPDKVLAAIAREGPSHGVHLWIWVDNGASLARSVDRAGLREFDWRVLFQSSAADSSALIDSGTASRLGPHRAILHDELSGRNEKFRPWATPEPAPRA